MAPCRPVTDRRRAPFPILEGAEAWSSPGSGPLGRVGVVVVHGFTGNPVSTRPLGEALARRGFAVEVPRLPGHGTHFRDMVRTRYADWRAEVEASVTRLRARAERVVLVGLSMGGALVLDVACRDGDLAGVVPINAPILDREGLLAKLAPFLEKLLPVVPASAAGLVANDAAKPGVDERAYAWVPAAAGNSLLRELPRLRRELATLRAPVLVVWSALDHSVPPENSRAIARLAHQARVEELVLERSCHLATLDLEAELLEERVAAFAERCGTATG